MTAWLIVTETLSGLVCGYITISLCESFFHRTIQHAGPASRHAYARAGAPGRALLRAWYSHHVIHHLHTYKKNHVTQFSDAGEQVRLDSYLQARGYDDIIECEYGIVLGSDLKAYVKYMLPTSPIFGSVCYLGGIWFTIGALVPLAVWPMLAQFVHPYLHMRREDILTRGPLVIRILAQSAYFKYLVRHHWLHHRYTSCNYNLLLGGDHLLGVWRPASALDFDEMHMIGLETRIP